MKPFDPKSPMTVYISGKMRGIPDYNYPNFHRICGLLRKLTAWKVLNPAELDADFDTSFMTHRENWHVTDDEAVNFLLRDVRIIQDNMASILFIDCDEWTKSTGARQELFVAQHIIRRPCAEYFEDKDTGKPFIRYGGVFSKLVTGNGLVPDTELVMGPESVIDIIPLGE